MIYFTNQYAKIWEIKMNEKYADVRISTSEKNQDGTYTNSNWFARCLGGGLKDIANFKEGNRIKITKGKVVNEPYTDKAGNKKSAVRVMIYGIESIDGNNTYIPAQSSKTTPAAEAHSNPVAETPTEDYPF